MTQVQVGRVGVRQVVLVNGRSHCSSDEISKKLKGQRVSNLIPRYSVQVEVVVYSSEIGQAIGGSVCIYFAPLNMSEENPDRW